MAEKEAKGNLSLHVHLFPFSSQQQEDGVALWLHTFRAQSLKKAGFEPQILGNSQTKTLLQSERACELKAKWQENPNFMES